MKLIGSLVRNHPRLIVAAAVGFVAFFVGPPRWSLISRILLSWNCGTALFLVLVYAWLPRLSAERIRSQYVGEDESAPVMLIIVVAAAILSVVAIVEPLANIKHVGGAERVAHLALAASTLLESWLLVPTIFTTHYADLFYSADEQAPPLLFPKTALPVFWDFAYFSFTISAACQTSDVSTTQVAVRKVVLAHTLVAFFFNASILGFAINVTAGLIGGN